MHEPLYLIPQHQAKRVQSFSGLNNLHSAKVAQAMLSVGNEKLNANTNHLPILTAVSQWSSGNMPDCGVRGPRFESHRRRLCLSRQPLRYTALGMGCTPLLQCLG